MKSIRNKYGIKSDFTLKKVYIHAENREVAEVNCLKSFRI
jgi:hypothetical protein